MCTSTTTRRAAEMLNYEIKQNILALGLED